MNAAAELLCIERCREVLGGDADDLSEEQIAAVRDHADAMALVIVELFLEDRSGTDKGALP